MNPSFLQDLLIGIPISLAGCQAKKSIKGYLTDTPSKYLSLNKPSKQNRNGTSEITWLHSLGRKVDNLANGVREHVRLGPKIAETVKGKLRFGARFLQVGGIERTFKKLFTVREGEKLLKASQCYLSTTSGPIAGLLFITTDRVAFSSEKSIRVYSPEGEFIRMKYKVMIPLRKIKSASRSENMEKPSQKYIEIVTVDDFDFWFMGFLNYQKSFKCIQQAISHAEGN